MQDNRNTPSCISQDKGMVCIDTTRVLDSCRDRDCFEDQRVYLTAAGEEILANATNVRTKSAKILWAYVGVNDVPFNTGFYHVSVRYYIEVTFEACVGIGKSQCFKGLVILEKEVVLYGGEGNITSYSSIPGAGYCDIGNTCAVRTNLPVAVVDTVEPVVLGTKVQECCECCCCECLEIPAPVRCALDGNISGSNNGLQIYVSLGLFSVIRIERPAQLLIQATDYCVPDKECTPATCNDNPCDLFRSIAFPTSRFRGSFGSAPESGGQRGGCGCGK